MRFEACPKCERITLVGKDQGLSIRLSTLVIPFSAAKCLANWGTLVYHIRLYGNTIVNELWSSSYSEPKDGWLVLNHNCGQDHFNWQFHPPTYGNVKKHSPEPAPCVPGFCEE